MAMTYQSKNQKQIDRLTDEYTNRQKFSYDPTTDEAYQDYAKMSRQEGALAMEDTLGKAASLTGGYGNSYATMAAGKVYSDHLRDIDAKAADYYAMALDKYNAEGNDILSRLEVLQQKELNERSAWERDYNRLWNEEEREYNRLWNEAVTKAGYGETEALAELLGMENTDLRSAMGIGALSEAQIEGYKNALMNGKGDAYLASLKGYDTDSLPNLAQQWEASGELDGTVTVGEDDKGNPTMTYEPNTKALTIAGNFEVPDWEWWKEQKADTGDWLTVKVNWTDNGKQKEKDYNLKLQEEIDSDEIIKSAQKYPDRTPFVYDKKLYMKADGKIFALANNEASEWANDAGSLRDYIIASNE